MDFEKILKHFNIGSAPATITAVKEGLINTTVIADFGNEKYTLQKINTNVFKNPHQLMSNIFDVTEYIKNELAKAGQGPDRSTLSFLKTDEDQFYYTDENGECWRCYKFVDGSYTIKNGCTSSEIFEAAREFGNFQYLLRDFDGKSLFESIKDFHNTPQRFRNLMKAAEEDKAGRAASVKKEIEFYASREKDFSIVTDLLDSGEIPVRVTHNDTKLNNVLFDENTKKAICVIDLDTVMPGSSLYDFGDGIRTTAAIRTEDDPDFSAVGVDKNVFTSYVDGYLKGTNGSLVKKEIELLPFSAKLLTAECGMRFLTDYLDGDVYFRSDYPEHNIVRARNQIKLVEDIEKNLEELNEITAEAAGRNGAV